MKTPLQSVVALSRWRPCHMTSTGGIIFILWAPQHRLLLYLYQVFDPTRVRYYRLRIWTLCLAKDSDICEGLLKHASLAWP